MTARDKMIKRIAEIEMELRHKVRSAAQTQALKNERYDLLNELRRQARQEAEQETTSPRHD